MAEIDLIPKDYAQSQLLRQRLRWFVSTLVAIVVLVALARFGLSLAARSATHEVGRLRDQGRIAARATAMVDAYRQEKLKAEKQLAALDDLRGRDRLGLFLRALDAAYVNGLWFDEIRYYRSETLPTGNLDALPGGARAGIIVVPKENVPAADAAAQVRGIEQHVALAGHALNHTQVAQFMRSLGSQPSIVDVRLVDTGLRAYTNALVIDFKLSLLVDDKRRRP